MTFAKPLAERLTWIANSLVYRRFQLIAEVAISARIEAFIRINDEALGASLHFFDANPRTGLISVTGTHDQLPEGFHAFSADTQNDTVPLQIGKYTPYEVQLQLVAESGGAGVPVTGGPGASIETGVLERIVLDNHSAVQISEQERAAAAIQVFGNGLHLRFNACRIRGDIDVMDWSQTFQPD